MKRYCPNCGYGTDYVTVKPTVCGKCRGGLELAIAPAKSAPVVITRTSSSRRPVVANDFPDEDELDFGIELVHDQPQGADEGFEIITQPTRQTMKIGDVAQTRGLGKGAIRDIPRNVNSKALLDELLPNRNARPPRAPAVKTPAKRTKTKK